MTNTQRADLALQELMGLLPVARIVGALDQWSLLYAQGYIIKLRTMR